MSDTVTNNSHAKSDITRLVKHMQRPNRDRDSYSIRTGRTQPALPGATLPTAPIVAHPQHYPEQPQMPRQTARKRPHPVRRALLQLLGLGILLEVLLLALYPL